VAPNMMRPTAFTPLTLTRVALAQWVSDFKSAFNVDTDTFDSLTHTAMQAILRLCVCVWKDADVGMGVWMVWMVWYVICDGFSCP